jgi:hypothetical protein
VAILKFQPAWHIERGVPRLSPLSPLFSSISSRRFARLPEEGPNATRSPLPVVDLFKAAVIAQVVATITRGSSVS